MLDLLASHLVHVLPTITVETLIGTGSVWLAALGGALVRYRTVSRLHGQRLSMDGFVRYLVPRRLILSPWTRIDLLWVGLQQLVYRFALAPLLLMMPWITLQVQSSLASALPSGPWLRPNWALDLGFAILMVLLRDAIAFYNHFLEHRVPLLWEFHKVHHAPETMIPPTQRRLHPVQEVFETVTRSVIVGAVVGCYGFLTGHTIEDFVIGGVGLYFVVKVISFYPLQHSHIDLRLGVLECVMLSPAHHILHHSSEYEHWDKNYGTILRIWDVLHGTLVTPPEEATFRLGLPGNQSRDYKGVLLGLLMPFAKTATLLRLRLHAPGTLFFRPPVAPNAPEPNSN